MKAKNIYPFDLKTARLIHDEQTPGKIVTVREQQVRILCWDANIEHFPLVGLVRLSDGREKLLSYTNEGRASLELQGVYDLQLLLPEDILYKSGDILKHADGSISILRCFDGSRVMIHAAYSEREGLLFSDADDSTFHGFRTDITGYATEEEKQQLISVLQSSSRQEAKVCLKLFFGIDEQTQYSFKPFDKVLVRDKMSLKWTCNIFSHIDADNKRNPFVCAILNWPFILPYNDKTKHLVGTTDNWEEE